jgi:hypothetical protein
VDEWVVDAAIREEEEEEEEATSATPSDRIYLVSKYCLFIQFNTPIDRLPNLTQILPPCPYPSTYIIYPGSLSLSLSLSPEIRIPPKNREIRY